MKTKSIIITKVILLIFVFTMSGCANGNINNATDTSAEKSQQVSASTEDPDKASASISSNNENSALDPTKMFTDRDLEQQANLDEAEYITLVDNENVVISKKGVYVISGDASNISIEVDAKNKKVQLVLDEVSIINDNFPVINVVSADKVFVTTTDSENSLIVSEKFDDKNLDSVIFSNSNLVFNGTGSLSIVSTKGNGIVSKDDLKITGGIYNIVSKKDGIKANDSIRIYGGDITISSDKDALHSENKEDESLGYIYIYNGILNIRASDDAIQGSTIVQIDGGTINIETCTEGIEGTYVQINGGRIDIYATDDGINATKKSDYDAIIEINDGELNISMSSGDTDALDANGNLYIRGGTINISAKSAFDYDNIGEMTGGNVTVNGKPVFELIPSQKPNP